MSKIAFSEIAFIDYVYWQSQDKKTLKRINQLLKDVDKKTPSAVCYGWCFLLVYLSVKTFYRFPC